MLADHGYFRYPLFFYCLFALGQFATGATLFVLKVGLEPARVLEYYAGSEAMLERYPERPDRFIEPRTAAGLLKVSLPHLLFYAFNAFFFLHLIRSLLKDRPRPGRAFTPAAIDVLSVLHLAGAALDIASGYLVRFGPAWCAYIRLPVFLWFVLSGVYMIALFAYLAATANGARSRGNATT